MPSLRTKEQVWSRRLESALGLNVDLRSTSACSETDAWNATRDAMKKSEPKPPRTYEKVYRE
eukprot:4260623-Amphidinium_carterae.1